MMKNQKPISIDYYLKYVCPNPECKNIHWLTSKESKVNSFKVVCDCGKIFSPLPIYKIKICYRKKFDIIKKDTHHKTLTEPTKKIETIDTTKEKFANTLRELGFTNDTEIFDIFDFAYKQCPTNDIAKLFKIGVLNQ